VTGPVCEQLAELQVMLGDGPCRDGPATAAPVLAMDINKDKIIKLLDSQGHHDQAAKAGQQLPDQVDTEDGQHAGLLSRLGLGTGSLGSQLDGLGKSSNAAGRRVWP
jgi:hypothetical protein